MRNLHDDLPKFCKSNLQGWPLTLNDRKVYSLSAAVKLYTCVRFLFLFFYVSANKQTIDSG